MLYTYDENLALNSLNSQQQMCVMNCWTSTI
jgi:hypothetical protein